VAAYTLDYWIEDDWYVGRLRQVPGIFSQGRTLEELKRNIGDAYRLMLEEEARLPTPDYESVELRLSAM
jgi:predicted RNase H-like HicB family nuclease